MPVPVPALAGDYVETSFDKDAGYLYTRYTIAQDGLRITLQFSRDEWDGSVVRYDGAGAIEKVYDDRPLVRLRFDDHTRRYFDLEARLLAHDAEWVWFQVSMPDLDLRIEPRMRECLSVLDAMGAVVDPLAVSPSASYSGACWPPGRELGGNVDYNFTLGAIAGPHYEFALCFFRDGPPNGCRVGFEQLGDGQSVCLNCWPRAERIFFGATCLPEHHAALEEVVRQRCVLEKRWNGRW